MTRFTFTKSPTVSSKLTLSLAVSAAAVLAACSGTQPYRDVGIYQPTLNLDQSRPADPTPEQLAAQKAKVVAASQALDQLDQLKTLANSVKTELVQAQAQLSAGAPGVALTHHQAAKQALTQLLPVYQEYLSQAQQAGDKLSLEQRGQAHALLATLLPSPETFNQQLDQQATALADEQESKLAPLEQSYEQAKEHERASQTAPTKEAETQANQELEQDKTAGLATATELVDKLTVVAKTPETQKSVLEDFRQLFALYQADLDQAGTLSQASSSQTSPTSATSPSKDFAAQKSAAQAAAAALAGLSLTTATASSLPTAQAYKDKFAALAGTVHADAYYEERTERTEKAKTSFATPEVAKVAQAEQTQPADLHPEVADAKVKFGEYYGDADVLWRYNNPTTKAAAEAQFGSLAQLEADYQAKLEKVNRRREQVGVAADRNVQIAAEVASASRQVASTPVALASGSGANEVEFADTSYLANQEPVARVRSNAQLHQTWKLAARAQERLMARAQHNVQVLPFNLQYGTAPKLAEIQARLGNSALAAQARLEYRKILGSSFELGRNYKSLLSYNESVGLSENSVGATLVSVKLTDSASGYHSNLEQLAANAEVPTDKVNTDPDLYVNHWKAHTGVGQQHPANAPEGSLADYRLPKQIAQSFPTASAAFLRDSLSVIYEDTVEHKKQTLQQKTQASSNPNLAPQYSQQQAQKYNQQIKPVDDTLDAIYASKVQGQLTGKGVQVTLIDSGFVDVESGDQAVDVSSYVPTTKDVTGQIDNSRSGAVVLSEDEVKNRLKGEIHLGDGAKQSVEFYGNRPVITRGVATTTNGVVSFAPRIHGKHVLARLAGKTQYGGIAPNVSLTLVSAEGLELQQGLSDTDKAKTGFSQFDGSAGPEYLANSIDTPGDTLGSLIYAPRIPHIVNASFGWTEPELNKVKTGNLPSPYQLDKINEASVHARGLLQFGAGPENLLLGLEKLKRLGAEVPLVVFAAGNYNLIDHALRARAAYEGLKQSNGTIAQADKYIAEGQRVETLVGQNKIHLLGDQEKASHVLEYATRDASVADFVVSVTGVVLDYKNKPEQAISAFSDNSDVKLVEALASSPVNVEQGEEGRGFNHYIGSHYLSYYLDLLKGTATANNQPSLVFFEPGNVNVPRLKGETIASGVVNQSLASDSRFTMPVLAPNATACGVGKYDCLAGTFYFSYIQENAKSFEAVSQTGTSLAAPEVTGIAALVKQNFPFLTAKDLKATLLTTATDLGTPGVDEAYGWGLVNAAAALRGPAGFIYGDLVADLRRGLKTVTKRVDLEADVAAGKLGSAQNPEAGLPYALGWNFRHAFAKYSCSAGQTVTCNSSSDQTTVVPVPYWHQTDGDASDSVFDKIKSTLDTAKAKFTQAVETAKASEHNLDTNPDPDLNNRAYFFTNNINGEGGLRLNGNSTQWLYLTGQNTYKGNTVVEGANLVYSSPFKFFGGTSTQKAADSASNYADDAAKSELISKYIRERLTPSFNGAPAFLTSVTEQLTAAGTEEAALKASVLPFSTRDDSVYYAASATNSDFYVAPTGALFTTDTVVKSLQSAGKVTADNLLVLGDTTLYADSTLTLVVDATNAAQTAHESTMEPATAEASPTVSPQRQEINQAFKNAGAYYCFVNDCRADGVPAETWNYKHAKTQVEQNSGFVAKLNELADDNAVLRVGGKFIPSGKLVLAPRATNLLTALANGTKYNLIKYGYLVRPEADTQYFDFASHELRESVNATSASATYDVEVTHDQDKHLYQASFKPKTSAAVSRSLEGAGLLASADLPVVAHAYSKTTANLLATVLESALEPAMDSNQETSRQPDQSVTQAQPLQAYKQYASAHKIDGFATQLATSLFSNNQLVATLGYRATASTYASSQTLLAQTTKDAVGEFNEVVFSNSAKHKVFANYKNFSQAWQHQGSYVTGTYAGHYVNAGLAFKLGKANLGLGVHGVVSNYSEEHQANLDANALTSNFKLGSAQVNSYGVSLVASHAYKQGYYGGSLSYDYASFAVKRSVLTQDDLASQVGKHNLLASFDTGAWLYRNQGLGLQVNTSLIGEYTYTANFSEALSDESAASAATLKTYFSLQNAHGSAFNLYASLGGKLSYQVQSDFGWHGVDLGVRALSQLTSNSYTYQANFGSSQGRTGEFLVPGLVGKASLGYSYGYQGFALRLGVNYSRASAWTNVDADVKVSVSF